MREGWPPESAKFLDGQVSIGNQLEAAMWAVEITTLEELKMLAELDATHTDCEHVRPGALGRAVLRILGGPSEATEPSALFSPPTVPRIGFSMGP